jgi:hypothetical protein
MRQKFVFVMAIAVCLSLTLIPAYATERTDDRYGERTKASKASGARGQEVEFSELTRSFPAGSRLSGNTSSVANKAAALISAAAKQEGEEAVATLQQVIRLDLPSNAQTDKIKSTAYLMMADLYQDKPSKQVVSLGVALQYTTDAAARARIQSRISDLGGNAFDVQLNSSTAYATLDSGPDDTCAGAVAVALPHSETMNIFPSGDANWRSFDVTGTGAVVFLETVSDFPGSGTDDTDLSLYDACGGTLLAFNDDRGTDFTSAITSDCLAPGTYYVEVGGFFDSATPDNFDLNISVVEACVPPTPDSYEPDNNRADAAGIGLPTATSGNGWGRVHKEIQARSIIPSGDTDHAVFRLTQNSLVRMGTRGQWPTFFNGFEGTCTGFGCNPDTVMTVLWENEPDYGGRCNQPDLGYLPICDTDADCPDPLDNPLPGYPDCIPYSEFGIPNPSPLAENDDRGGGDFGSELLMCLPRTASGTPAGVNQAEGGGFLVQVDPFSSSDTFDYELNVKNEVGCLFEVEPNNTFDSATPYAIGSVVSGFYDFSVTQPYADDDYYQFDVADGTSVAFQTFAPDANQSDTALELLVGPDDDGIYYFTGVSNDDGGSGFLSALAVTLPSASTLLGNTTADADYFMNVTSNYFNPNYYYDMASAEIAASSTAAEAEPNNDISTANTINIGGTVIGEISGGCDVDTFRFSISDDTFIHLNALAGGDSAINLVECGSQTSVACDDDSGGNMLPSITGCLPAGEYCAQVRAFSSADAFSYEVQLQGTGGCDSQGSVMSGDNSFTCLDFATCN